MILAGNVLGQQVHQLNIVNDSMVYNIDMVMKAGTWMANEEDSSEGSSNYRTLTEQDMKMHNIVFDESGSIGKRYRRQDEIGTPLCITYDFESAHDNAVTVRFRDTTEQVRISIDSLEEFIITKTMSQSSGNI